LEGSSQLQVMGDVIVAGKGICLKFFKLIYHLIEGVAGPEAVLVPFTAYQHIYTVNGAFPNGKPGRCRDEPVGTGGQAADVLVVSVHIQGPAPCVQQKTAGKLGAFEDWDIRPIGKGPDVVLQAQLGILEFHQLAYGLVAFFKTALEADSGTNGNLQVCPGL